MKYELYEIYNDNGTVYNYTNNVEDVIEGVTTYTAQTIARNEIELDGEKDDLELTAPIFLKPFDEYIVYNPILDWWFKIYIIINGVKTLVYSGKIVSVSYNNDINEVKARCASLITVLSSNIPTKKYSPNCPFRLFDIDCGLNKNDYKFTLTTGNWTIVNNKKIIITGVYDKSFKNGLFFINGQPLFCINEEIISGTHYIHFEGIMISLDANSTIEFYYGCDKTITDCEAYNNKLKFGGFPYIPKSNPYLGF